MTVSTFVVVYVTHVVIRIMTKMLKKRLVEIRTFDYYN